MDTILSFLELIETAIANNIDIFELPAHTSNWLQPCDRTVFGPFKNAYRKACDELTSNYPRVTVARTNFCGLLKKAWMESVTSSNAIAGFRACGIYPFDPSAVPDEAYLPSTLNTVQQMANDEGLSNSNETPTAVSGITTGNQRALSCFERQT